MQDPGSTRIGLPTVPRLRASLLGQAPPPISGVAPDSSPAAYEPGPGRTVLMFLTSSCLPCRTIWASLSDGSRADTVAVTPDAATEDRAEVRALAGSARVIMSTAGWLDYGVSKAPWSVVVDGGVVVADGPAA